MKTFNLRIELGDAAMSTPHDVSVALANLAASDHLYRDTEDYDVLVPAADGTIRSGTIRDANGNTVGEWSVTA